MCKRLDIQIVRLLYELLWYSAALSDTASAEINDEIRRI